MNQVPQIMKGVQLIGHGGMDKLVFREDIPVPIPGKRDVLIKVAAAGINNTDLNTRLGWYSKSDDQNEMSGWSGESVKFPRIQGADVCGYIVAVGEEVDTHLIGQRVLIDPCLFEANGKTLEHPWYFGSECDGGFAEYTTVAVKHAHPIISKMSDAELASFPCSYSTAENLLTRAKVTDQDTVLVTGASGGVGSAVVQLAKARGAKIMAITSPSKAQQVRVLGADKTFARDAQLVEEIGADSIDVVIDLVAGNQWPQLLNVLKPFGRYATSGAIAGAFVDLDVRTLYLKDLTLYGCTVLSPEIFPNLIKRIEAQDIKPLVEQTFSLDQIVEAQKQFETKQHIGKLVIEIAKD